jgi:hypothetical protein
VGLKCSYLSDSVRVKITPINCVCISQHIRSPAYGWIHTYCLCMTWLDLSWLQVECMHWLIVYVDWHTCASSSYVMDKNMHRVCTLLYRRYVMAHSRGILLLWTGPFNMESAYMQWPIWFIKWQRWVSPFYVMDMNMKRLHTLLLSRYVVAHTGGYGLYEWA